MSNAKIQPGFVYRSLALLESNERWWRVDVASTHEVSLLALVKGEGDPSTWEVYPQRTSYVCRSLGDNFERWQPCPT